MFRRPQPMESVDISKINKNAPVVDFTESKKKEKSKIKNSVSKEEVDTKPKIETKKLKKLEIPKVVEEVVEVPEQPEPEEMKEEIPKTKKARMVKGSDEARAWAVKMKEIRKSKMEERKKAVEVKDE